MQHHCLNEHTKSERPDLLKKQVFKLFDDTIAVPPGVLRILRPCAVPDQPTVEAEGAAEGAPCQADSEPWPKLPTLL